MAESDTAYTSRNDLVTAHALKELAAVSRKLAELRGGIVSKQGGVFDYSVSGDTVTIQGTDRGAKTITLPETLQLPPEIQPKRKRGRPKGSRNRPK